MATAGPTICGTGADGNNGLVVWTNPGRITANDNLFAQADLSGATLTSNEILATNFGFTIPGGATINGIQVDVSRKRIGAFGQCQDNDITLLKAGVATGNNKGTTATWPTVKATASYGGAADLWGSSWTPANINAVNFGVQVSATDPAHGSSGNIDFVQITITYTPVAGVTSTMIGFGF